MGILDENETGGMNPLQMGSLAIGITGESERCVGVLFSQAYSDLLDRAVKKYVEASDNWEQHKDDADAMRERRLAFVDVLNVVSSGCEELAASVAKNYSDSFGKE